MTDEYQIDIPPSFFAVFSDARGRLRGDIATVRTRYDICEDLAQQLVEQARLLYHTAAPSEAEILRRIHTSISAVDAGLSAGEARWVVQRLAELVEWPCPALDDTLPPEAGSSPPA